MARRVCGLARLPHVFHEPNRFIQRDTGPALSVTVCHPSDGGIVRNGANPVAVHPDLVATGGERSDLVTHDHRGLRSSRVNAHDFESMRARWRSRRAGLMLFREYDKIRAMHRRSTGAG